MENPNQMSEQRLPDTKLKLVEEVNDQFLGNIEFLPRLFESFIEGILHCGQTINESTTDGNFTYNSWYRGC